MGLLVWGDLDQLGLLVRTNDLGLVQDYLAKARTGLDYWFIGLVRTNSLLIGPGSLGALQLEGGSSLSKLVSWIFKCEGDLTWDAMSNRGFDSHLQLELCVW